MDGLLAALPSSVIDEAVLVRMVAQVLTSLGCRCMRSTAFSQSPVSMNQNSGGKSLRDDRFADEAIGSGVSAKVCRPIISSKIPFPSPSVFDAHMTNANRSSTLFKLTATKVENNEPWRLRVHH